MDLRNYTGRLERGEAFVRAKAALADTEPLSVHIKFTKAKGRDVSGYYRWKDRRMVLAVKQRLRYPRAAAYGVGTTPRENRRLGGAPYHLVWHEERFESPDDLLVFVAGHEFWHYLCHSGQRKRDHETKANCNGFAWLREFRSWTGPGSPVAEIPPVPPRPDRSDDAAPSSPHRRVDAAEVPLFPGLAAVATRRRRPAVATGTERSASAGFDDAAATSASGSRAPAGPSAASPKPPSMARGLLDAAKQLLLFR